MPYVLVDRPVPEVAVATLNRPERLNAMAFDVMVPLRDALRGLGEDNVSATSLETYLHSEGLGQLYLRLLTDNFEEATQARKEGRAAVFRDDR